MRDKWTKRWVDFEDGENGKFKNVFLFEQKLEQNDNNKNRTNNTNNENNNDHNNNQH